MKKMLTAILLFDLIAGLLFLGMQEMRRYRSVEAGSSRAAIIGEDRVEDIKKIAITFDDEVIIGLSQEIGYQEAISMI